MNRNAKISPPKWADRFLEFYCREEFLEEIQGDIHEIFEQRVIEGPAKAKAGFVWDVLRFFRLSNLKIFNRSKFNQLTMVKNNFKIATRSLMKHRFYALINLTGISLGIACFILTYLYVQEEFSFDKFHNQSDNIYRVWVHEVYAEDNEEYFEGVVPVVLGTTLKQDLPGIEEVIQIKDLNASYVSSDQKKITIGCNLVGSGFLKAFDFKLIVGDRETALDKLENIVLTEKDAIGRFGKTDVLGETIKLNVGGKDHSFVVSGVIENRPENSSVIYGSLISDPNNKRFLNEQSRTAWFNFSSELYVLLNPNTKPESLEGKFPEMVEKGMGENFEEGVFNVHLQPLKSVHFDTKVDGDTIVGDIKTVRILGVVGVVILFLAGINFVNLSVGQSMKRAKEVGVRKVMGAFKKQLILQFLSESFLLTFLAMIISLGISRLLLPVFNEMASKNLSLTFSWPLITALALALLCIGLLSGIYPALVISSFKPVNALKGIRVNGKTKSGMAYSLIVFQFFVAIFFVSTTIVMKNQLNYLSNKDLGFDQEAIAYMRMPKPKNPKEWMDGIMISNGEQADQFLTSLRQLPTLEAVAYSNNYFGDEGWMEFEFKDKEGKLRSFHYNNINENFIELFNIELVQGKSFENASEHLKNTGIIVNEALIKQFGIEGDPIGAKIEGGDFLPHEIIGVVKDFHYASLHERVKPLVMSMNPTPMYRGIEGISINQNTLATVLMKVNLETFSKTKADIKKVWESRFEEPFEIDFLDTKLKKLYEREARTNSMVTSVALLAIAIASLGLLGLAALTIKNKLKEIGVRKVLGASSSNIFQLLFRVFLSPIFVAFLLSVPLTVYVMNGWLESFEYHININFVHFISAFVLIVLTTLLVVSYQSLKASKVNPVETIRYE